MDIKQIITALTEGEGVSGNEQTLGKAAELLSEYAQVRRDSLGSIIGTLGEGKTHIMLDAHLDRIGLIVTAIDDSGFLRVDKCGGCDPRILSAATVTVWGKKPVFGVITSTPPHLAKAEDSSKAPSFDNLYVDTGLDGEALRKTVSVGDRITIDAPVISLTDNIITGSALDDRIGVAALLRVADILKEEKPAVKVTFIFSAQEETTEAGAKTGAFAISPDEAIAVDVSFGNAPGISDSQCGKLGDGGMICISPSLSNEMTAQLMSIADKKGIKHKTEVCPSSTGTNADVISVSKSGVKTGLVSIPLRNMHTQAELADIDDIESVAQIIASYIIERGESENA
ncbi:MAG: M20/M25/M40 family metallo-hydrolase [Clostridia bacterium]|nr:M20/M25/M40 family metallo-hydrolase [Clostridia bacterium]